MTEIPRHGARPGRRRLIAAAAIAVVAASAFLIIRGYAGSHAPSRALVVGSTPATGATPPASPSGPATSAGPASASASPATTPSSGRPTPDPRPSTRPPAKPPVTTGTRKGVSAWSFDGVNTALVDSGARWYYTWSTSHGGITTPKGVQFVPMIWGPGSVTTANLAAAKAVGGDLLGFNEPDLSSQSNMSVDQALDLWPKLQATGLTLGSPAVAYGGATPGGWLDRFMSGAAARGYRVDFITLHWYGGDFTTSNAVSQLKSYLTAVHDRYHKPIWLTEYALIDFSNGTRFPSDAQQAAFVTASTRMLDGLSWLARYAWFALPADDAKPSSGLYTGGPKPTAAGRAFEAAS